MIEFMMESGKFFSTTVRRWCADGTALALTNGLFGVPLYAWYVFEMDVFEAGDIEGTLLTPPFEIYGPLDSRESGDKLLQSLVEAHSNIEQV